MTQGPDLEQARRETAAAHTAFHRMPSRHALTRLLTATRNEALTRLRARGHHTAADYLDTQEHA